MGVAIGTPPANAQTETVLHKFNRTDGEQPHAGVIRDSAGTIYGTTSEGGTSNWGVVFKLDAAGKETVLYNFKGEADGGRPWAGLIGDSAGPPARGAGVVFKIEP
jgi:uncharacterized repeat protein (TIGR03803 family)